MPDDREAATGPATHRRESYLLYFDTVDQRWMLAADIEAGDGLEPWIPAPAEIDSASSFSAREWATAQLAALYGPATCPTWQADPAESPGYRTHLVIASREPRS